MKGTSHNVANMIVFMPRQALSTGATATIRPPASEARDPGRTPEQSIDLYRVITATIST